jgi:hypothetical protein
MLTSFIQQKKCHGFFRTNYQARQIFISKCAKRLGLFLQIAGRICAASPDGELMDFSLARGQHFGLSKRGARGKIKTPVGNKNQPAQRSFANPDD